MHLEYRRGRLVEFEPRLAGVCVANRHRVRGEPGPHPAAQKSAGASSRGPASVNSHTGADDDTTGHGVSSAEPHLPRWIPRSADDRTAACLADARSARITDPARADHRADVAASDAGSWGNTIGHRHGRRRIATIAHCTGALAYAGGGLSCSDRDAVAHSLPLNQAPMKPLAVSIWSFHAPIFFEGRLTALDALALVADLGFTAVEFNDLFAVAPRPPLWLRAGRKVHRFVERHLPRPLPAPSVVRRPRCYRPELVEQIASAAARAGVRIVSWTLDTNLTATGPALAAQRRYWQHGLETACTLGAEVMRITTGGPMAGPDTHMEAALAQASAILAELTDLAERAGVVIAVENHWGLSADPVRLAGLIRGVGAPRERLGVCLDFGNFPAGTELAGIQRLAPLATHVHAKSYSFGADGEEQRLPYGAILRTLAAAGYHGWLVVEYEGDGDPAAGVSATRALIERHWPDE